MTLGFRMTLGKYTDGLRMALPPTIWQTSLRFIESWVWKFRHKLGTLGVIKNFTNQHVVRVSHYIRDQLCKSTTDGPHVIPGDMYSKGRITDKVHKNTNIKNLIEPFFGSWLHCPICFMIVRSCTALNAHMDAWHGDNETETPKIIQFWVARPANFSMHIDNLYWCPMCEFSAKQYPLVWEHLKNDH